MSALALAAWLTLGWLPMGAVAVYNPPSIAHVDGSFSVEIGVEASWGPLFAGGAMLVPVWKYEDELSFWPTQLISTTDIGVEVGVIRLGWRHTCAHPVAPYLPRITWRDGQLVPGWDSSYDMVYLRIGTKP